MAEKTVGSNSQANGTLSVEKSQNLGRKKSEIINLNYSFNHFNSIKNSGISNEPYQLASSDFFKKTHDKTRISHDIYNFENVGDYIGVVLKIVRGKQKTKDEKGLDPNWLTKASEGQMDSLPKTVGYMKVRIPELHAHMPIPLTYTECGIGAQYECGSGKTLYNALSNNTSGDISRQETDNLIIDMYPVFTFKSKEDDEVFFPQIGSLVWVNFTNKTSQSGGYYVRPLSLNEISITSEKIYGKSSGVFNASLSLQQGVGATPALGQQSQTAEFNSKNSPFLQRQGNNFYTTKGGYPLETIGTIGGFNAKIIDEKGNLINQSSKILNRGIYRVPTKIEMIKNVPIRTSKVFNPRFVTTNSVRVYSYGNMNYNSQNLSLAPTALRQEKKKIHVLALNRLNQMNYDWANYLDKVKTSEELTQENLTGIFQISKGFIRHKYNDNYQVYVDKMVEVYGSLENGMLYEPFHSEYETGLVFDISNNNIVDENGNINENSFALNWLLDNAFLYGIYPSEHSLATWQVQIPRKNWYSGEEFADETTGTVINGRYYKYCAYIVETSEETNRKTSDKIFATEIFR